MNKFVICGKTLKTNILFFPDSTQLSIGKLYSLSAKLALFIYIFLHILLLCFFVTLINVWKDKEWPNCLNFPFLLKKNFYQPFLKMMDVCTVGCYLPEFANAELYHFPFLYFYSRSVLQGFFQIFNSFSFGL